MPAARAGLSAEYRVFYDALQDYGDWPLIEPFGYVFRPYGTRDETGARTSTATGRPREMYGWVWISSEPYGWATYHYGDWFYDDYQGWVWIPGLDWGPAWVSWVKTPDYIGWAPLFPPGYAPETGAGRRVSLRDDGALAGHRRADAYAHDGADRRRSSARPSCRRQPARAGRRRLQRRPGVRRRSSGAPDRSRA